MLIKLKNAVFEWTGYFVSIFRLFRRSKKKNVEKETLVNGSLGGQNPLPVVSYNKNEAFKTTTSSNGSKENLHKVNEQPGQKKNGFKTANRCGIKKGINIKLDKGTKRCQDIINDDDDDNQGPLSPHDSHSGFYVCEAVTNCDIERVVAVPPHIDEKEWIASHLLAFFHHVNALYGSVSEFCSSDNCPMMNGKDCQQVLWIDEKGRKCKYAAQQYMDCALSFIEKLVDSEEAFPTKFGNVFPTHFDQSVKKIFRLLYNVLNHVTAFHISHFDSIGLAPQIKTLTSHFVVFCKRYDLLDAKLLQNLLLVNEHGPKKEEHNVDRILKLGNTVENGLVITEPQTVLPDLNVIEASGQSATAVETNS